MKILLTAWYIPALLIISSCSDQAPSFEENYETEAPAKTFEGDDALGQENSSDALMQGKVERNSSSSTGEKGNTAHSPETNNSEVISGDKLATSCETSTIKTASHSFSFESRSECRFNEDGNESRVNTRVRAREAQSISINLPSDAILCGIDLQSKTNTIRFDDYFSLNMNGYVVAASGDLVDPLEKNSQGLKAWDWSKVIDAPVFYSEKKYCLSGNCELPPHDEQGPFKVNLSLSGGETNALANLFAAVSNDSQMRVTAVATGDNDDGDCYHSGGSFDVEFQYIEKN